MISLDRKLAHVKALRASPAIRLASCELPLEAGRLPELLGAACARNRYGEHLVVRRWHAQPEACVPQPQAVRLLAPDAPGDAADSEQWLFLDTETTGLAGGTGTYAFLVGVAWWDAGGLQVEQFFMRDHSEEHSLLVALSERLAERRVLVTFNGKSFDWPLLETRYRMTRQIHPRAPRAHLDLLHPARQVWRLRLGSVRLTELERQVLGGEPGLDWRREGDIPSHLIPQTYFDYLRGGPAEPLAGVFQHNEMDLRGLAALAGKMLAMLQDPEAADGDALELYGLSKLLQRRGERGRARQLYERAIATGLTGAVARAARRELAALAKRERDFARATQLWHELIRCRSFASGQRESPRNDAFYPRASVRGGESASEFLADRLDAYEQLAIYYEHHAREPERAAELTRKALAELRWLLRAGGIDPARHHRLRARLDHRLARLTRQSGCVLFRESVREPE